MWLVLCNSEDASALWAYHGLKARGLEPIELISAEVLSYSLCWEHRLRGDLATIDIKLADGRWIHSNTINGVLNRLLSVPLGFWRSAAPTDRDYVLQELTAFYLSWLYALSCPVINRPTPQGLSGQWRHESEWVWLASQAGLPTADYRQTSLDRVDEMKGERRLIHPSALTTTVIVFADQLFGVEIPRSLMEGCRRLAEFSDTALLGIEFATDSHSQWKFVGATPSPDLSFGGSALLDALAWALEGESPKP
jgi:hypothetical protein